jgi:molybdopterin converting factor small subunit
MNVTVEFSGIARVVTGIKATSLTLDADTTYRDVIHHLAERYPKLLGQVVEPETHVLYPSHMLNLNGKHMVSVSQMDESPRDGDCLTLMSILAGG